MDGHKEHVGHLGKNVREGRVEGTVPQYRGLTQEEWRELCRGFQSDSMNLSLSLSLSLQVVGELSGGP